MRSISYEYRIGYSTVSHIIHETTKSIWDVLYQQVFPQKFTADYWNQISNSYENHWNFPHCLGSLDGKHINIQVKNIYLYCLDYNSQ